MRSNIICGCLLSWLLFASSAASGGQSWPDQIALGGSDPHLWRDFSPNSEPIALPESLQTPLGSLWKLFVYSYLVAQSSKEPVLRCEGKYPDEKSYCCDPGESIDREQALIRSCGPYFDPVRVGITPSSWQHYWQSVGAPDWLTDLTKVKEQQRVTVHSLLTALALIPSPIQKQVSLTLAEVTLQGRGKGGLGELGTLLRAKSFTMPTPEWGVIGGGAGWSDNGTPMWFSGHGGSPEVFTRLAPALAERLQQIPIDQTSADQTRSCVNVRYFARYPLAAITREDGKQAEPGPLNGSFTLRFNNGQQLSWKTERDAFWLEKNAQEPPVIWGRFAENDYIARVIDREGDARYPQAARALAIAARTYLYQQASHLGNCLQLDDSSRFQRVSPHSPSQGARYAARATQGLVIQGTEVRYHHDQGATNQLSWQHAVQWDQLGLTFADMLARAYPAGALRLQESHVADECTALTDSQQWLQRQIPLWQQRLRAEPGFEPLPATPAVCLLLQGNPYADKPSLRIYVRRSQTLDGRIALTHEYLHLAFAHHPLGDDEDFIENLARRLVRGEP